MSATQLHSRPRLAPGVRFQKDALTGGAVLLYPEGLVELNDTAGAIVQRCDGEQTLDAIIGSIAAEYDVPREELVSDVIECLDLRQRKLMNFEG